MISGLSFHRGHRQEPHLLRSRPEKGFCAVFRRGPGGVDVVHQDQPLFGDRGREGEKRSGLVPLPGRVAQILLDRREGFPSQKLSYRDPEPAAQLPCQKLRLVIAPLPPAAFMQRHRHKGVRPDPKEAAAVAPYGFLCQKTGRVPLVLIFQPVDDLLCPFVIV